MFGLPNFFYFLDMELDEVFSCCFLLHSNIVIILSLSNQINQSFLSFIFNQNKVCLLFFKVRITTEAMGIWRFAGAFAVVERQSELKISEANAGAPDSYRDAGMPECTLASQ